MLYSEDIVLAGTSKPAGGGLEDTACPLERNKAKRGVDRGPLENTWKF